MNVILQPTALHPSDSCILFINWSERVGYGTDNNCSIVMEGTIQQWTSLLGRKPGALLGCRRNSDNNTDNGPRLRIRRYSTLHEASSLMPAYLPSARTYDTRRDCGENLGASDSWSYYRKRHENRSLEFHLQLQPTTIRPPTKQYCHMVRFVYLW